MSSRPFMQFCPGDFVADTGHLHGFARGVYACLLFHLWMAGGRLPASDEQLARLASISLAEWETVREPVLAFLSRRGAWFRQKRVTRDLARLETKSCKRREAGRKGGLAKARNYKGNPLANAKQNGRELELELESKKETPPKPPPPGGKGEDAPSRLLASLGKAWATLADLGFEDAWNAYPHRKGRSARPKALAQWRRIDAEARAGIGLAAQRYAVDGYEPHRECGAPAMQRWLSEGRYADWLPGAVAIDHQPTGPPPALHWRELQRAEDEAAAKAGQLSLWITPENDPRRGRPKRDQTQPGGAVGALPAPQPRP